MTKQNPFNSQQESTPSFPARNAIVKGFNRGAPMLIVSGLPFRAALNRKQVPTARFDRRDDEIQCSPLSNQPSEDVVEFQKVNRIQTNDEGVFIPRTLLRTGAQVRLRHLRMGSGEIEVIIHTSQPSQMANARRRAERLDCTQELAWLAEHSAEYAGRWVALEGGKLLSSGPIGRDVYNEALKLGSKIPFLVQVEKSSELPFGGW